MTKVVFYCDRSYTGRLTVSQRYQERFGGRRRRRQFVDGGVAGGCHPLAAASHCVAPTVFARVTAHVDDDDDDDDDDDRRLLRATSAFPPYCCGGSHHMTMTTTTIPPPAPPPTRLRFASPRERQIETRVKNLYSLVIVRTEPPPPSNRETARGNKTISLNDNATRRTSNVYTYNAGDTV